MTVGFVRPLPQQTSCKLRRFYDATGAFDLRCPRASAHGVLRKSMSNPNLGSAGVGTASSCSWSATLDVHTLLFDPKFCPISCLYIYIHIYIYTCRVFVAGGGRQLPIPYFVGDGSHRVTDPNPNRGFSVFPPVAKARSVAQGVGTQRSEVLVQDLKQNDGRPGREVSEWPLRSCERRFEHHDPPWNP